MEFWMFISDLLIPLIMILFGRIFSKCAPKEINGIYGYRTSMSMKNKDTWEFAHRHCAKIWFPTGLIMFLFSVIAMLFMINKNKDVVGTFGGILCVLQVIVLFASIVPT